MATAKIVLKKKLKNGDYRVTIRLAHLNEPARYINLPFQCKPNQWIKESQRFRRNKNGYKRLNQSLSEVEDKIEEILSLLLDNNSYSFNAFRDAFLEDVRKDTRTVKQVFHDKLSDLEAANRIGSYITYKGCLSSLEKYKSLEIDFSGITFKFLKGFEQYHLRIGNKPNTIGNYLRSLRALHYEYCKINNLPRPAVYQNFNIARLKNDAVKRSLTKTQLVKFRTYTPKTKAERNAQLLFMFSFYCRGINLMDMLQLTEKNINNGILVYIRQKTGKPMRVKLVPEALQIIECFKNDSQFIFPYLRKSDIPKHRVRSINRYVNEQLEIIGKSLNFDLRLSFYAARHSFSELNYKAGVRIEIISQMLGHADLKTTQTYLRSFTDDEVDNAASSVFDML